MADEQKPIAHKETKEIESKPKKKGQLSDEELSKLSGGPIYMDTSGGKDI